MKIKFTLSILLTLFMVEVNAATVYCRCKNTGGSKIYNTKQEIALSGNAKPVCDKVCSDKGGTLSYEKK